MFFQVVNGLAAVILGAGFGGAVALRWAGSDRLDRWMRAAGPLGAMGGVALVATYPAQDAPVVRWLPLAFAVGAIVVARWPLAATAFLLAAFASALKLL